MCCVVFGKLFHCSSSRTYIKLVGNRQDLIQVAVLAQVSPGSYSIHGTFPQARCHVFFLDLYYLHTWGVSVLISVVLVSLAQWSHINVCVIWVVNKLIPKFMKWTNWEFNIAVLDGISSQRMKSMYMYNNIYCHPPSLNFLIDELCVNRFVGSKSPFKLILVSKTSPQKLHMKSIGIHWCLLLTTPQLTKVQF